MSDRYDEMAERLALENEATTNEEAARAIASALRAAAREENEACAKLASQYATGAANAIRARKP